MSEEKLSLKEKVRMMARKNLFFIKDEIEETENGDWYHTMIFEKNLNGEKREVEVVFDYFSIVRVNYRAYFNNDFNIEYIFYPRMPCIDLFVNHKDETYQLMTIDIKFNIEKILEILFMLSFPEFWVWANLKNVSLVVK